jgi:hypothetical protein
MNVVDVFESWVFSFSIQFLRHILDCGSSLLITLWAYTENETLWVYFSSADDIIFCCSVFSAQCHMYIVVPSSWLGCHWAVLPKMLFPTLRASLHTAFAPENCRGVVKEPLKGGFLRRCPCTLKVVWRTGRALPRVWHLEYKVAKFCEAVDFTLRCNMMMHGLQAAVGILRPFELFFQRLIRRCVLRIIRT